MVSTHANTGSPRVERCDRLTRDAVSLVRRLSGIRPLAVGTGTQPAARVYECAHVFTWIEQTARFRHSGTGSTSYYRMNFAVIASISSAVLLGLASSLIAQPDGLTVVAVLQDETALAGAHVIRMHAGLAYVAGKGGSLAVVSVAQPSAPELLWSNQDAEINEDAQTVLPLDRGRLLVGARELLLFDIRQPSKPALLATLRDRPRIDQINSFARFGDTVYGANSDGYIFSADVSGTDKIRLLGTRAVRERDNLAGLRDVALAGEFLVVVDGGGFGRKDRSRQLGIYSVIDSVTRAPLAPEQWGSPTILTDRRFAGANRVVTAGSFAYVGSKHNVTIVDLSNPAKPSVRGSIAFPDDRGPTGLAVSGHIVFAAGGQTVQALDVSNPAQPRELARVTAPAAFSGGGDDARDLGYHDGHLFVTAQTSHALVVVRVDGKQLQEAARP